MAPTPMRPWHRFDLYAITWIIAIAHAGVCVGCAQGALYASTKDYAGPIDFGGTYLLAGVVYTVVSLLAILVVVALLWRSKKTSGVAIAMHALLITPGSLALLGTLLSMVRPAEQLLLGLAVIVPSLTESLLSILNLKRMLSDARHKNAAAYGS